MGSVRHKEARHAVTGAGSGGVGDGCQACQRSARRMAVVVRRMESEMGERVLTHQAWGAGLSWQQATGSLHQGDDTACTVLLKNNAGRCGPGQRCGRRYV
jgi:hypothetical protein